MQGCYKIGMNHISFIFSSFLDLDCSDIFWREDESQKHLPFRIPQPASLKHLGIELSR